MTDTISSCIDIGQTIPTWSDLAGLVEKYCVNHWIFRGVDNAGHKLVPAIGRPGARKDMDTGADRPFDEAEERNMLSRLLSGTSASRSRDESTTTGTMNGRSAAMRWERSTASFHSSRK
jgi:hypothetical protein